MMEAIIKKTKKTEVARCTLFAIDCFLYMDAPHLLLGPACVMMVLQVCCVLGSIPIFSSLPCPNNLVPEIRRRRGRRDNDTVAKRHVVAAQSTMNLASEGVGNWSNTNTTNTTNTNVHSSGSEINNQVVVVLVGGAVGTFLELPLAAREKNASFSVSFLSFSSFSSSFRQRGIAVVGQGKNQMSSPAIPEDTSAEIQLAQDLAPNVNTVARSEERRAFGGGAGINQKQREDHQSEFGTQHLQYYNLEKARKETKGKPPERAED